MYLVSLKKKSLQKSYKIKRVYKMGKKVQKSKRGKICFTIYLFEY